MILFYKVGLPRCRCGNPAAYQIRSSGNVRYDEVCAAHADRRVRELTKAHNQPLTVFVRGAAAPPAVEDSR